MILIFYCLNQIAICMIKTNLTISSFYDKGAKKVYIKYNHVSIIIISFSIITALTSYAFAKTKQKCFTCVCQTKQGSTIITSPNCNFDSIMTNKSLNELPSDLKKECTKSCQEQDQKYVKHMIWSE